MNKRKLLSLALTICMVAILAAGGTLAYFMDTDNETNTFTIGNVQIDLIEMERRYDEDGKLTGIDVFTNDKKLAPIVGSAQGAKDAYGLPTAKNFQDKIITVKVEDGSEDAYVRVLVAFPAGMDADAASDMPLHWSAGNKYEAKGGKANPDAENADYANWTAKLEVEGAVINKVEYNIYSYTHATRFTAGQETPSACIVGFYLDSRVDYDGNNYFMMVGNEKVILSGFNKDGKIEIPVYAQGIQAEGFANAAEAFAASGLPINPWEKTE